MEFDHVGRHCSLETCHQRDFLPFTCDICKGSFCLDHRTYASHNCVGKERKDMTSISCPICGDSIKFSQSQNIDELWTIHFENECIQTSKSKAIDKCVSKSCKIRLGPSNRFQCPQCKELVCLSHRRPEDHQCRSSINRSASLKVAQKSVSSIPVGRDSKPLKNEAFLQRFSEPAREAAPIAVPNHQYRDDNSCPVCLECFPDAIQLIEHVETRHSDRQTLSQPQIPRQSDEKCAVH